MAKMQANQMRAGMVIEFEGARYTILKQNIMIPGKGAAVIQVEMRNVKTGAKKEFVFGRNEGGAQYVHGWIDEILATPDEGLSDLFRRGVDAGRLVTD